MLHVMPYCPDKSSNVQERDQENSRARSGVRYSHCIATERGGGSDNLPDSLDADVHNCDVKKKKHAAVLIDTSDPSLLQAHP